MRPPSLAYGCYAETAQGSPLVFLIFPAHLPPTRAIGRGANGSEDDGIDTRPSLRGITEPVEATEFVASIRAIVLSSVIALLVFAG